MQAKIGLHGGYFNSLSAILTRTDVLLLSPFPSLCPAARAFSGSWLLGASAFLDLLDLTSLRPVSRRWHRGPKLGYILPLPDVDMLLELSKT
jgi:hypothetical protein